MGKKIAGLFIQQFRGLTDLRIEEIGHVNLITGMNNTGKTSVLEAVRILASEGSMATISAILRLREEDSSDADDNIRAADTDAVFPLCSLFGGFPEFSEGVPPVLVEGYHGELPLSLSIETCWINEVRSEVGVRRFVEPAPTLFSDDDSRIPGIRILVNKLERLIPLDALRRGFSRTYRRPDLFDDKRIPCQYVGPGNADRTAALGILWDRIALSDLEAFVVEALQLIDSDITAVSMVGGEGNRSVRTAIVRSHRFSRPVPLRSFGDGVNRLFGIVLSLVNAKDGFLLIDEIENGLHHTVQADAWKLIFHLAAQLNVQVFATTHSLDAIEAFQSVACQVPEEGVLVRLARKGRTIIATSFSEDELVAVTRHQIEVR